MDGTEVVGYHTNLVEHPLLCLPCAEKASHEGDPKLTPITLDEAWGLCENGDDQCSACNECLVELALIAGKLLK